ncbi:2OG-Fe(II) oxygenase [Alphaproteobacteria bacterium]|jgi:predicted 2-oxoglutarate/Fe(II)-dependent dioxygenase YbiX/peroxiredoxin|nr:2OG-Fe(II) oxygenase [Alphaproteobacteria bacterium]
MAPQAPPPLDIGDIAPRFTLPRQDGGEPFDSRADTVAGKPMVLAIASDATTAPASQLLASSADIDASGAQAIAMTRHGGAPAALIDQGGQASTFFAGGKMPGTVVIGRNGHVLAIYRDEPETQVDRALKLVQALAADTQPKPAERQAPVLIVPDVLTPVDCKRLITIYNMDGNVFVEPGHGVQKQRSDYKMRIPEYGRKDRIDHWVVNQKTQALINDRLQRRLFPEISKAFHYRVTRHESYRIGSYEGERGGELHGHRDNVQANVAHRRFACSINLNAEDFEGGELAFPEFGAQRFSPATGEAVVFSSSLLHEPLHVTKGRRLVLLAFLFGET